MWNSVTKRSRFWHIFANVTSYYMPVDWIHVLVCRVLKCVISVKGHIGYHNLFLLQSNLNTQILLVLVSKWNSAAWINWAVFFNIIFILDLNILNEWRQDTRLLVYFKLLDMGLGLGDQSWSLRWIIDIWRHRLLHKFQEHLTIPYSKCLLY